MNTDKHGYQLAADILTSKNPPAPRWICV